jgi:hypothetical protein
MMAIYAPPSTRRPSQFSLEFIPISKACPISAFRCALSGEGDGMGGYHLGIHAILGAAIVYGIQQPTRAYGEHFARVRANGDPSIAALIQEGAERSGTFQRLVETIDASDGLVYVERGKCGHHVRACLALTVTVAGPNRILRIVVEPKRNHEEQLAAIGHELQHAVEALGDPHVTDYHTLYSLFNSIGSSELGWFETHAAIQTELAILNELRAKVH